MVSNINSNYYYYNSPTETYIRPSRESAELGYLLATAATALVYKSLPSFSNPFLKQMTKEHAHNNIYKDVFIKAVEHSGLEKKGLTIVKELNPATEIGKGLNACYIPSLKTIKLNTEKASISGFHELGHAINHLNGGIGKILQKMRGPGYAIASLMATIALFSRDKAKGEKRNLKDIIQDNCGKIAFAAMLPTVAEETLASYRGINLAKKAGLEASAVKNLKKFYGKALLSYGGYALVTGIAVFVASKITEIFTRPKKFIETSGRNFS